MKKKIIIGLSVFFILSAVIMHFLIKENGSIRWLDFIIGATFGLGISLPVLLLNEKIKD